MQGEEEMYKKIKELCKAKGITIAALESALGFARGYLYKWDENTPGVDKVKKVADYFGVKIEELL